MPAKQAIFDRACSAVGSAMCGWRNAFNLCNIKLLPLAYHVVSDRHVPHVAHLHGYKSIAQFRADLDFLLKNFTPIEPDTLPNLIEGRPDFSRPSFLLTIDDGLREIRDVIAPILLEKGIPAILFVNSDFVDNKNMFFRHKASLLVDLIRRNEAHRRHVTSAMHKHMPGVPPDRAILRVRHRDRNWLDEVAQAAELDFEDILATERPYLTTSELTELARKGFTIGAHSNSHPHYGPLSHEEQLHETLGSIEFVKEKFAPKHMFFAFPFHDLDVPLSIFVRMKEVGVRASFGTHAFRSNMVMGNIQRLFADEPDHRLERLIARKCGELMILAALGKARIVRA